jgi:hypothetical protein
MKRMVAMAIGLGLAILFLTIIVFFWMGISVGPPEGIVPNLLVLIQKFFGG